MKEVILQQGSQEWLDFRKTHITATDTSAILGINPWCSANKLWKQKLGLIDPEPLNERMKRGQLLENEARLMLSAQVGYEFNPSVVIHDTESWAMASLDGITPCKRFVCELKAPNRDTHELAIQGQVKPYYYCQIQKHLWVTGCDFCFYVSYMPEHEKPFHWLTIDPDQEYIASMIEKERDFYFNYLCAFREPEEASFKFKMKTPS